MHILYIADDGTNFDNEWDCEMYEDTLKHLNVLTIEFYDRNNDIFYISKDNIYDEDVYANAEKVRIHNEAEFNDFKWLSKMCGYCEFDQITSLGFWTREERGWKVPDGLWTKVE